MPEAAEFEPDWFSPPGVAIAETLRRAAKPLPDFLFEMGISEQETERLLDGRMAITDSIAQRLEKSLGVSASFWMTREAQYRRDMVRLADVIPIDEAKAWLREIPVKDMVELGWIERRADTSEKVAECFRYFDVPSIGTFDRQVDKLIGGVQLRTSATLKSKPAALAAWLRRGELDAERLDCQPWDVEKFRASLPELRKLTLLRDPQKFLKPLRKLCAESGVALVIARGPSGCRASGATKFIAADKALLMLSFRYLTDDHFWFSFFHECGHLILHGKERIFIEGEPHDTRAHEQEANEFAQKALIPDPWYRLLEKLPSNKKEVLRFAVRVGVSPGIVVGQLQHRGRIAHNYLNYLKRRFVWE